MHPKTAALAGCTIGNMIGVTPMIYTVFGLFLIPISSDFGWPRSAVSIVLLILAIVAALSYPIIGRSIDRYGARRILIGGVAVYAAAVALLSLTTASPWVFYPAFAFVGVAAAIPSSAMFTKVIAGWYMQNRGFALGLCGGVGNGVGAAISPIITAALIATYGWRGAFVGIGCIILAIGLPAFIVLLRDPPEAASAVRGSDVGLTLKEAMGTTTFWVLLSAIGLGAGCMTAVFAHVVPMLLDRGIAMDNAVSVLVTFSLVTAAWQVGIGAVLDRVSKPWIGAPFYIAAAIGLVLLDHSSNQLVLLSAGVLMGLGLGTEYGVMPYLLSRYFGVAHYGAISGAAYGVIVLVQGVTPFLMDLDYDLNGSYDIAITVICTAMALGAILLTRLKPLAALQTPQGAPA
jgi:MFS family permease